MNQRKEVGTDVFSFVYEGTLMSWASASIDDTIADIQDECRVNNKHKGISGVLFFYPSDLRSENFGFLQLLQGPREDILELVEKIMYDKRLRTFQRIAFGFAAKTCFEEFAMKTWKVDDEHTFFRELNHDLLKILDLMGQKKLFFFYANFVAFDSLWHEGFQGELKCSHRVSRLMLFEQYISLNNKTLSSAETGLIKSSTPTGENIKMVVNKHGQLKKIALMERKVHFNIIDFNK